MNSTTMAKQQENNIKLGIFVLTGLVALIIAFYMIGKNRSLFGSNFELKVRFANLNGLVEGDNVSYAGIHAGTVRSIDFIDDTTIEVLLLIDNKLKPYIHKNAKANIGTEGMIGEKLINIIPVKTTQRVGLVEDGDQLASQPIINTDEMLVTLSKTNTNIAIISESLKNTALRINNSKVWDLLNDRTIGAGLRSALKNVDRASANANQITISLNELLMQVKDGKGLAGILFTDTTMAVNLKAAISQVKAAGKNVNSLTMQLDQVAKDVNNDIQNEKGTYHLLIKDSAMAKKINVTIDNIQKGTDSFNQTMEAIKHSFLFRGYFRKLERAQKNGTQATSSN